MTEGHTCALCVALCCPTGRWTVVPTSTVTHGHHVEASGALAMPRNSAQKHMSEEYMTVSRYRGPSEALDELEREANVRSRCFPRWIREGKVSKTDAKDRLDRLGSAIKLLDALVRADGNMPAKNILAAFCADYSVHHDVTSTGDMTEEAA